MLRPRASAFNPRYAVILGVWVLGSEYWGTEVLVEAAGVEPASENVAGKEPTYLVGFTLPELPGKIRLTRSEPTRNALG
jgi:hypothetical protein